LRWPQLEPDVWKLDDVFPDRRDDFDSTEADLKAETKRMEAVRPRLPGFTKKEVEQTLRTYERINDGLSRLSSYAYMRFSEDTRNQKVKSLLDRAEELRADVDNRVLFFRLWWIGLEDAKAKSLLPSDGDLRYFMTSLRKLRPHTLEEKVEQAVNLKNTTGFSGWVHHYDQITTGYTFQLKVRGKVTRGANGKPREFTRDEISRLYMSSDGAERKAAYTSVLGRYGEGGDILGEVYRTIVRDWRNEYVKMRAFASPISARNLENDVRDRAVETLLAVCREKATVFQDFFRLKARMLGAKRLSRYDLYAPLLKKVRRVPYGDAVRLVMDAFQGFDQRYAELAMRVFRERHVDSSPHRGKETGAYCMSVAPDVVPFLLLNYSGVIRDAYTIAHESGHAIHSQLASNHSVLTFQPQLVLAETASVFGEMILYDKMMRDEEDSQVKKGVLLDKLSDVYATIGRQSYFVMFELEAHRAVSTGATVSELCALYLKNLREQFGPAVNVPDEFGWEWASIPHIYHTPFYCYSYAFGNLLSLALYDRYTAEGRPFVPTLLSILSHGGSASPGDVLDEVGIDISSARFWRGGFDVIARMVGELEKL
jgi:oligoendopeptidase F